MYSTVLHIPIPAWRACVYISGSSLSSHPGFGRAGSASRHAAHVTHMWNYTKECAQMVGVKIFINTLRLGEQEKQEPKMANINEMLAAMTTVLLLSVFTSGSAKPTAMVLFGDRSVVTCPVILHILHYVVQRSIQYVFTSASTSSVVLGLQL